MEKRSSREILKTIYDYYDISFVGEVLKYLIPLPVPASIYGLVIMLVLLQTNLLPLESIKEAGLFLVEIMPVMFIPAAVGLMDSWGDLKPILVPFIVITFFVTVIVMVCGGHAAQFFIRRGKKQKKEETEEK